MLIQAKPAWAFGLLGAVALLAGAAHAQSADQSATSGSWQQHSYTFHFMGFTTTYSCDGLEDKLRFLLRVSAAGPEVRDIHVSSPCTRGDGRPDKLAMADLTFSTLQPTPAGSDGMPTGVWRHVALSPRHPFQLDDGDCELIEQFRDKVLPMFATRNLDNKVSCVPHQESGSNYYLSYDVFGPPMPLKKS